MITLREYERIVSVFRRHHFVLLVTLIPIVGAFFLVLVVAAIAEVRMPSDFGALKPVVFLGAAFFLHLLWLALFITIADFVLDVWVLTDKRMIMVEQKGLFARMVAELDLDRVQDAGVEVNGIIATFLNFGNVRVHTASEREDFVLAHAARPHEVKDTVMRSCAAFRQAHKI